MQNYGKHFYATGLILICTIHLSTVSVLSMQQGPSRFVAMLYQKHENVKTFLNYSIFQ